MVACCCVIWVDVVVVAHQSSSVMVCVPATVYKKISIDLGSLRQNVMTFEKSFQSFGT
jgi:hypothetical protein